MLSVFLVTSSSKGHKLAFKYPYRPDEMDPRLIQLESHLGSPTQAGATHLSSMPLFIPFMDPHALMATDLPQDATKLRKTNETLAQLFYMNKNFSRQAFDFQMDHFLFLGHPIFLTKQDYLAHMAMPGLTNLDAKPSIRHKEASSTCEDHRSQHLQAFHIVFVLYTVDVLGLVERKTIKAIHALLKEVSLSLARHETFEHYLSTALNDLDKIENDHYNGAAHHQTQKTVADQTAIFDRAIREIGLALDLKSLFQALKEYIFRRKSDLIEISLQTLGPFLFLIDFDPPAANAFGLNGIDAMNNNPANYRSCEEELYGHETLLFEKGILDKLERFANSPDLIDFITRLTIYTSISEYSELYNIPVSTLLAFSRILISNKLAKTISKIRHESHFRCSAASKSDVESRLGLSLGNKIVLDYLYEQAGFFGITYADYLSLDMSRLVEFAVSGHKDEEQIIAQKLLPVLLQTKILIPTQVYFYLVLPQAHAFPYHLSNEEDFGDKPHAAAAGRPLTPAATAYLSNASNFDNSQKELLPEFLYLCQYFDGRFSQDYLLHHLRLSRPRFSLIVYKFKEYLEKIIL